MNQQMNKAEGALLHTYNRFQRYLTTERVCIFTIQMEKNIWILQQELQ